MIKRMLIKMFNNDEFKNKVKIDDLRIIASNLKIKVNDSHLSKTELINDIYIKK